MAMDKSHMMSTGRWYTHAKGSRQMDHPCCRYFWACFFAVRSRSDSSILPELLPGAAQAIVVQIIGAWVA
eukprot:5734347-Amphidinium_carterae.1